jgi:hypothetical protein
MTSKPSTADGYGYQQLGVVRRTCLYVATKLGDLLDEIVVVGGLVPYLLVDQQDLPPGLERHEGTTDLDIGMSLAMLNRERYRELGMRLRDAGFQPDVNEQGKMKLQTWTLRPTYPVSVDLLIPPTDDIAEGGHLLHIESDLAAIVTPGLELAFLGRRRIELSGRTPSGAFATRIVPVCGPGAFTVLKALAFGNRAENKDAYDLFYVWRGVGIPGVVESLTALQPSVYIDDALDIIARDFCRHDGLGPLAAAGFVMRGPDDNVQADVVGYAVELLRCVGRR